MFGEDEFVQCAKTRAGGFENDKDFGGGFDFAPPAVVRLDFRNEVGAGDKTRAESFAGETPGDFEVRRGDKNQREFFSGFHVRLIFNGTKP